MVTVQSGLSDVVIVADWKAQTVVHSLNLKHIRKYVAKMQGQWSGDVHFTGFAFDDRLEKAFTIADGHPTCSLAISLMPTEGKKEEKGEGELVSQPPRWLWCKWLDSQGMEDETKIAPITSHGLVFCYYYAERAQGAAVYAHDSQNGDLKWKVGF